MSVEKDHATPIVNKPSSEAQMPSQRMRLSTEEVRILQECNRESFYFRSLPFAAVAATATHLAVKRGLLKSHPRWGSSLKVIGAGFVGWFIGKISYRSTCEEKFLQLQNSQLADLIRKKRGYILETPSYEGPAGDEMLYADDAPAYSFDDDYTSSSRSLNLDIDRNIQYSGLDISDRSGESDYDTQHEDKAPKYTTTYDDLKRKNREEYELRQSKLYQPPSVSSSVHSSVSSARKGWSDLEDKSPNRQSSYRPGGSGMENAYGDRWDK